MRPTRWYSEDEQFVQDSVPYTWKMKQWAGHKFKLFRGSGDAEREVGLFWQKMSWGSGGVCLLDCSKELLGTEVRQAGRQEGTDVVVGLVTCLIALWKKRARNSERHS